jgi:hypothetical protein
VESEREGGRVGKLKKIHKSPGGAAHGRNLE